MTSFIIVESPAKAKKIQHILGENVRAKASMGHIRDLPENELGVDLNHNFAPHYKILTKKSSLVNELKDEARNATTIYLATDEDREGEAISWHLANILRLPVGTTPRMVFHEITPKAIRESFQNPRNIHLPSVDSQQTRRILDRLVGYKISPLLCRSLGKGKLSAGRVQSAALRILVDRERDHEQFQNKTHISILGKFGNLNIQWKPNQENMTPELRQKIINWIPYLWELQKPVEVKQEKENPPAPFTTSTLAQEASKRLHYNAKMTAQISQGLYEAGWITYHRTDSVAIADEAKEAIREWVSTSLGQNWVKNRIYSSKQKNAQEAHECIRPVQVDRVPGLCDVPGSPESSRLYALIWCRTIATQVIPASYEKVQAHWFHEKQALEGYWEWVNRQLMEEGYLRVWRQYFGGEDENQVEPMIERWWERNQNQEYRLDGLRYEERPQEPPVRYRESSFIKVLEQRGIGRPSTYASIVGTLTERQYIDSKANVLGSPLEVGWEIFLPTSESKTGKKIVKVGAEKGVWKPTPLGREVMSYLEEKFEDLVQDQFTATMEHWLDEIATERTTMGAVLRVFWDTLSPKIEIAEKNMPQRGVNPVIDLGVHPAFGHPVFLKKGRYGLYVECGTLKGNLPEMREWTLDEIVEANILPIVLGVWNGKNVLWKTGKYGNYLAVEGGGNYTWEGETVPIWEEVAEYLSKQGEKKVRELSKTIVAQTTKYGWALRKGTKWAKPPAGTTLETITLEEAKNAFVMLDSKNKRK